MDKTFKKKSINDASVNLLSENNCYIDNLIFRKYLWILNQEGVDSFISKFESGMPSLAIDALLIHLHKNNKSQYESSIEIVAKLGHPFVMAYYGQCCYEGLDEYKEVGIEYLKKAARHNCALALKYLGWFYKTGVDGFYQDTQTAKSYFSIAVALGEYDAKKEL